MAGSLELCGCGYSVTSESELDPDLPLPSMMLTSKISWTRS